MVYAKLEYLYRPTLGSNISNCRKRNITLSNACALTAKCVSYNFETITKVYSRPNDSRGLIHQIWSLTMSTQAGFVLHFSVDTHVSPRRIRINMNANRRCQGPYQEKGDYFGEHRRW
jgi:hypothetical protein